MEYSKQTAQEPETIARVHVCKHCGEQFPRTRYSYLLLLQCVVLVFTANSFYRRFFNENRPRLSNTIILIISLNFKKYLQQGCEKAVILKMEKFLIIFHAFIIIIKLKPRNFIASLVTNFLISIFNLFCFLIFIMVLLHLLMT